MDRAQLPQDELSGAISTIDIVHHETHEGDHYTVSYRKNLASVASTSTMLITTPAEALNNYVHIVCSVEADKKVIWTLSEGATASGGSAITALNNLRYSTETAKSVFKANAVITTAGTVLETHMTGSASTPQSKSGGSGSTRMEWIFKPASNYLLTVTGGEATTDSIIIMQYYHHKF